MQDFLDNCKKNNKILIYFLRRIDKRQILQNNMLTKLSHSLVFRLLKISYYF